MLETLDLLVYQILYWAAVPVGIFAFVHATLQRADAYTAADKLTKPGWVLILVVFSLSQLFQGWLSFFGLIGIVAAAVYLVDARPALRAASGRGRGGWGIRRRRGPRPL